MVMGGVRSTGAAQCRLSGLLQTPLFLCSYIARTQYTYPRISHEHCEDAVQLDPAIRGGYVL